MPAESRLTVTLEQEEYPRYDPAHGTPDPMTRRLMRFQIGKSEALFEQTDYGHPGRFNAWEPRGVDGELQPRTQELRDVCAALASLLGQ